MAVLEPLALLFREEVRAIAETLGHGQQHRAAQAVPADGLGGADHRRSDPGKTGALRKADAIFSGEIREAGLNKKLYKYFPIMVDAQKETSTISACSDDSLRVLVPARRHMIWWNARLSAFWKRRPLSDGCFMIKIPDADRKRDISIKRVPP